MAATLGFYFAGMTNDEANEVRRKMNEIAAAYGYVARSGPTKGEGNATALLKALANGELRIVKPMLVSYTLDILSHEQDGDDEIVRTKQIQGIIDAPNHYGIFEVKMAVCEKLGIEPEDTGNFHVDTYDRTQPVCPRCNGTGRESTNIICGECSGIGLLT